MAYVEGGEAVKGEGCIIERIRISNGRLRGHCEISTRKGMGVEEQQPIRKVVSNDVARVAGYALLWGLKCAIAVPALLSPSRRIPSFTSTKTKTQFIIPNWHCDQSYTLGLVN